MNILYQILDGVSFAFLIFCVAAGAFAVFFTVSFIKSRKSLTGKTEISDSQRANHRQKRRFMIALLIIFAVMFDLTLSAFITRGMFKNHGYKLEPVNSASVSDEVLKISPLNEYKVNADKGADVKIREGKLKKGGTKSFSFTAKASGTYLFRVTEMTEGMEIKINLRDSKGNNIDYASGVKKYVIAAMDNIEKGTRYTVTFTAIKGEGEYRIEQITPKNFDIKNYTAVKDSIEYSFQSNVYFFTPVKDGVYCFYLTDVSAGCNLAINVPEAKGQVYIQENIKTVALEGGKTYRINVNQMDGYSDYTLNVMREKNIYDISDVSEVRDCFEFIGQHNSYTFSGKSTISLKFELNGTYTDVLRWAENENIIYPISNIR
ncbi:MAG: hypothetical protein J6Q24_02510, partial [Clostridia bacterium]|nr:hypothetical protein [Clostridia bacterium]